MRALRLLHELLLGDKKLLVKVDAKTKAQLDEWKAKKRGADMVSCSPVSQILNEYLCFVLIVTLIYLLVSFLNLQEGSGTNIEEEEEEILDDETLIKDQGVRGSIEVLIREYANELNAPSQDPDSQPRNKKRKEKKEEVPSASFTSSGIHRSLSETGECSLCSCSSLCARRISVPWRSRKTRET